MALQPTYIVSSMQPRLGLRAGSWLALLCALPVFLLTACSGGTGTPSPGNPPTGNVYHLSTSGNDQTGNGADKPWFSLTPALNIGLKPGDTVNLDAGIYQWAQVAEITNANGAINNPIVIQTTPGSPGLAIIDGGKINLAALSGTGDVGLFTITNSSYLTVRNIEFQNFTDPSGGAFTPVGILVTGSGTGLQLLNNKIHDIKTTESGANSNAHGLEVYGDANAAIDQITISGNEIYNLKLGWSESMVLDGNVTNFMVTNNSIHDNDNIGIDIAGGWNVNPSGNDQPSHGLVSGNILHNVSDISNTAYSSHYGSDGLYCDGCANVVFERNLVSNCDLGIEAASENLGVSGNHVTIRNNVFMNNNSAGVSIGGYSALSSGSCTGNTKGQGQGGGCGSSDHVVVVNNTFYNDNAQGVGAELQIQFRATSSIFENNLFYAGAQNLWIYAPNTDTQATLNWNDYYSLAGYSDGNSITWLGNSTYGSFNGYQNTSGEDPASLDADPSFVSLAATTINLELNAGSIARHINSGSSALSCSEYYCGTDANGNPVTLIYGNTDFAGNAMPPAGQPINLGGYQDQ